MIWLSLWVAAPTEMIPFGNSHHFLHWVSMWWAEHCGCKFCWQVALKFEHRSSKGCNYGPPYEWQVYKYGFFQVIELLLCVATFLVLSCAFGIVMCFLTYLIHLSSSIFYPLEFSCRLCLVSSAVSQTLVTFAAHLVAVMGCPVRISKADKGTTMSW